MEHDTQLKVDQLEHDLDITIDVVTLGDDDRRYNRESVAKATIRVTIDDTPEAIAKLRERAAGVGAVAVKYFMEGAGLIAAKRFRGEGRGPVAIPLSEAATDKLLRELGFGAVLDQGKADTKDAEPGADPTDAEVAPDLAEEAREGAERVHDLIQR